MSNLLWSNGIGSYFFEQTVEYNAKAVMCVNVLLWSSESEK